MNRKRVATLVLTASLALVGLVGCAKEEPQPDFSGYSKIAELATLECTYHNVAEVYNDGTDMLFGINVGYKKAWFEYDGIVRLGVDASRVSISGPNEGNVVTIAVPQAQMLGLPDVDESTFSDVYRDTGWFTSITTVDQQQAYASAQESMAESVQSNEMLIDEATNRARTLLSQYVLGIGEQMGVNYEIQFVEAE